MSENTIIDEKVNKEEKTEKKTQVFDDPILQAMADAGVYYGRKKTKTHPNMRSYIYSTRNNIEILDLEKTRECLDSAKEFIRDIVSRGGFMLFVGTQPAANEATKNAAEKSNMPYVINRWIGGTLTNFKVIFKRIDHLKKSKEDIASGALEKYTKRERVQFNKQFSRLEQLLTGLESLTSIPDVVFIANTNEHSTALREAKRLKIPVVAIIGTDSDPTQVTRPIPANDAAKSSLKYLIEVISQAVEEGIELRGKQPKVSPADNKKEDDKTKENSNINQEDVMKDGTPEDK